MQGTQKGIKLICYLLSKDHSPKSDLPISGPSPIYRLRVTTTLHIRADVNTLGIVNQFHSTQIYQEKNICKYYNAVSYYHNPQSHHLVTSHSNEERIKYSLQTEVNIELQYPVVASHSESYIHVLCYSYCIILDLLHMIGQHLVSTITLQTRYSPPLPSLLS